jgi:hypothetical protein
MYLLDEKNIELKLKIQKRKTMTLRWTQHTEFKIVTDDKKIDQVHNSMYSDYVSYLGNMDTDNTIIKFQMMNGIILTILKNMAKNKGNLKSIRQWQCQYGP